MDYFKTLNLEREPFSNSPDPGLFFNSKQHLEALQKLEISLRLKRGLNVITGDVGTGKTTLSRQLIQKISHDQTLEFFLILDPGFTSTKDFLNCIVNHFSGQTQPGTDETTLKEQIKKYLFSKGVDHQITTVLMIDEGQKLPVFCLEVLRELLNYETNDNKLLQIIIFAQKEFNDILETLDNFNDRINFRYELSPLGFSETKELIKFRLENSSVHPAKTAFFTFFAYMAIYHYTNGFPRKIINLCHHIMIGLIIRNRTSADCFFVAACAKEVFLSHRPLLFRRVSFALIFLICIGLAAVFNPHQMMDHIPGKKEISNLFTASVSGINPVGPTKIYPIEPVVSNELTVSKKPPVSKDPVAIKEHAVSKEPVSSKEPALFKKPVAINDPLKEQQVEAVTYPQILGTLRVPMNETLCTMIEAVYGQYREKYLEKLLNANRNIKNPDKINAGMQINFPVISRKDDVLKNDAICILLLKETEFKKAFMAAQKYRKFNLDVRILSAWDVQKGFLFTIVVNKAFDTLSNATAYKEKTMGIKQGRCEKVSFYNDGRKFL